MLDEVETPYFKVVAIELSITVTENVALTVSGTINNAFELLYQVVGLVLGSQMS